MTTPSPTHRLSDYHYHLPPDRIAQRPATPRDHARLLVSRPEGVEETIYHHLTDYLDPGDLLVVNDTRVIPARLKGHRPSGGKNELFLIRPLSDLAPPGQWEALVSSNKKIKKGLHITFSPTFSATVLGRTSHGFRVQLESREGSLHETIHRHGQIPLPPYITASDQEEDQHRYQTVFARQEGAVAAPTAGLHLTEPLLGTLRRKGIEIAPLTLHVGIGTFQPVREENLAHHVMHQEWCHLPPETARKINHTRQQGGRVVAVGTTVMRTLESAPRQQGEIHPFDGNTHLFILPGFRFRVVDLLLTNFHLPHSTLLMLVAAFIGKDRLDRDYAHAIRSGFRFYSYGDTSLLFPRGRRS